MRFNRPVEVILLIGLLCSAARSQEQGDSSGYRLANDLGLSLQATHLYQTYTGSNRFVASVMPNIPRSENPMLQAAWGIDGKHVTDNPLPHGASFFVASLSYHPGEYLIDTRIIAEQRGVSYGVHNLSSIAVIPQITIGMTPKLAIGDDTVRARLLIGDFVNYPVDEGLTIYNMDWQGSVIDVEWNKLYVSYSTVGDAGLGIGLNLDQAEEFQLGVRAISLGTDLTGTASLGWWNYPTESFAQVQPRYYSASYHVDFGRNFTTYAEASYRLGLLPTAPERPSIRSPLSHEAFLIGVRGRIEESSIHASWVLEYRQYGNAFNFGNKNFGVYYRDTTIATGRNLSYGNTIGDYLYPLYYFGRPLSQWALYTDYQDEDISSLIIRCDLRYDVARSLFLFSVADLNLIWPERTSRSIYPLFDAGIGFTPIPKAVVKLSATNRAMNLDKHFPTYYLYKNAVANLSVNVSVW